MSSLMRTGLKLLGAGILAGCGMFLFRWGPCGPSSIWGMVFLLAALGCLSVGSLFVVVSLLRMLLDRLLGGRVA
jgi:hypothetical protein